MSQTPLHYKDVSSHDFAGQLYQTAADCRLHLDSEQELHAPVIAYETYGQLNADQSNAHFDLSCFDGGSVCDGGQSHHQAQRMVG